MNTWDTIGASGYLVFCAGLGFIYWPLAPVFVGLGTVVVYVLREVSENGLSTTGDTGTGDDSLSFGGRARDGAGEPDGAAGRD